MGKSGEEFLERARLWSSNETFDESSRAEIQKLIEENNRVELEERFYRDLEFGTGGIRALIGQGTNRLNRYNIRRGHLGRGRGDFRRKVLFFIGFGPSCHWIRLPTLF